MLTDVVVSYHVPENARMQTSSKCRCRAADVVQNVYFVSICQEEMTARVQSATSSGYRVEIHVIGDQAADVALTALETVNVSPEKRPILIHCQVT